MAASKRKPRRRATSPAEQGIRAGHGKGGVPVPVAHQFPPKTSGNPAGRPSAGATLREQFNALAASGLTQAQLRRIATDTRVAWTRSAAAREILKALEYGDLADMEPLLDGRLTLKQLRQKGVNTAVIRKVKVKTRTLRDADGEDVGTEVEREVELHDRGGDHFNLICDQTESRPKVNVHHTGDGTTGGPAPIVLMHSAPPPDQAEG
jgi:hypothetical protein